LVRIPELRATIRWALPVPELVGPKVRSVYLVPAFGAACGELEYHDQHPGNDQVRSISMAYLKNRVFTGPSGSRTLAKPRELLIGYGGGNKCTAF
jgi:hypothetical protein